MFARGSYVMVLTFTGFALFSRVVTTDLPTSMFDFFLSVSWVALEPLVLTVCAIYFIY